MIDNNEQCPVCQRWFHENCIRWHIEAIHGPNAENWHKKFVENARRNREAHKSTT